MCAEPAWPNQVVQRAHHACMHACMWQAAVFWRRQAGSPRCSGPLHHPGTFLGCQGGRAQSSPGPEHRIGSAAGRLLPGEGSPQSCPSIPASVEVPICLHLAVDGSQATTHMDGQMHLHVDGLVIDISGQASCREAVGSTEQEAFPSVCNQVRAKSSPKRSQQSAFAREHALHQGCLDDIRAARNL